MKRKLSVLSVLIALLTLVLVFTACGDDGNITSTGGVRPRTITIYSITGDSTTPAAVQAVEDALNRITEPLYKTHVVLRFYKADEYEAALRKAVDANENGDVVVNLGSSDTVTAETVVNEYGRPLTIYPEADPNQMDIFLIPEGVDNFDFYTQDYLNYTDEDGELVELGGIAADLSAEMNADGAGYLLNQYIPEKVLNFCRENSIDATTPLYGIPSNRYYGDAEYLLINKKLFAEMNYDPSIITDMYSVQNFLVDLAAECKDGGKYAGQGIIPLYNTPSMNLVSVTGKKSVVAQCVANNASVASGAFTPMNIFSIPAAQKGMAFVSAINVAGGIMPRVTENIDFNTTFGAAFVYGNAGVMEQYADDYYVILNSVPYIEGEDIYKGVYAISNYAMEIDRCMEILVCLNTNAEFRNLMGYGVENQNYIIDEENGRVVKINDTYEMDLEATGNMFLLKQNDQMTEEELALSANNWAVAKATNNEAIVSPYAKFSLSTKYVASEYANLATYVPMALAIDELEMLYDEIWTWIAEYPTYASADTGEKINTFSEYLLILQNELKNNIYVSSASSQLFTTSIYQQYTSWYGVIYGGAPTT